mgnify:CR=1 FL=1
MLFRSNRRRHQCYSGPSSPSTNDGYYIDKLQRQLKHATRAATPTATATDERRAYRYSSEELEERSPFNDPSQPPPSLLPVVSPREESAQPHREHQQDCYRQVLKPIENTFENDRSGVTDYLANENTTPHCKYYDYDDHGGGGVSGNSGSWDVGFLVDVPTA